MKLITGKNIVVLILFFIFTYGTGLVGTIISGTDSLDLYSQLNLPFFAAPSWVFSPVWAFLYASIAIAAFIVWKRGSNLTGDRRPEDSLFLFFLTVGLSTFWTPIFFNLQLFGVAFLLLLVVAIFSIVVLYQFFKASNWSGFLFLPFVCWVVYATLLNGGIVILN